MKKHFLRMCSWLLSVVLLINMLPMSIFAEEFQESVASTDATAENTESAEPSSARVVDEIIENRTEYSKEFLLSNGLHMAAVYPDPVHYATADSWEEIDNTLVTQADGSLTNTAGVWNVSFPSKLSENESVTIEKDGYTLSFSMSGELNSSGVALMTADRDAVQSTQNMHVEKSQKSVAQVQQVDISAALDAAEHPETVPAKLQSRITYDEIYEDTDLIYDLESNTVKESVVLAGYSDTLQGYRYTLNVGQMVPVLQADGQIIFYDREQENVVMVMPAPYLIDNTGAYNDDIQVQLTGSGSKYTMTYLLPKQWLAEETRAWPVVLDPAVTPELTTTNIRDRTVAANKTYSQSWGVNSFGYDPETGAMRFYLKYSDLPQLTSSDVIVSAYVQMYAINSGTSGQLQANVHKVTGTWDSESITWANKPSYNTNIEDYAIIEDPNWYGWVITDIVREWYASGNTGMMFKAPDGVETSGTSQFKQFFSSDFSDQNGSKPVLTIQFRNNNGLEDYWDYTATSGYRAGTGYINNYTGNLVWLHEDIGFGGNRMPVSIRHIYNANDIGTNQFAMGSGWRTNFNQIVYQWSTDSSYYIWEDADGTDHYFKHSSANTYKDEDGLELTLTTGGTGAEKYCIEDKYGNKSYFDTNGRLRKMQDNQQSSNNISVSYTNDSSKYISSITDGVGRVYTFCYAATQLQKITYKGAGTNDVASVWFWYDGWDLVTIKETDGRYSNYRYNDKGLITTVIDIDDYILNYSYNTTANGLPPRVSGVEESNNGKNGGKLNIEYAHNQTTFTDHNDNVEIHQFNNFGNTISIQDDEGHAQYSQYARNTDQDTTKTNQLTLSSRLQNTVGNKHHNGSFEYTLSSWSPNASTITRSKSSEKAYYGTYSLKAVSTSANVKALLGQGVSVSPGESITFSGYLYTTGVGCSLGLHDYINGAKSCSSAVVNTASQWTRTEVTYTNDTDTTQYFNITLFLQEAGTVYMDCVQVEKTQSASRFNLVDNGDFANGFYAWVDNSGAIVSLNESATKTLDGNVHKMVGVPTYKRRLSQTLYIEGTANDSFVVAGWAKGDSAPLTDGREFAIWAIFHYTDGETETFAARFNPDTDSKQSWQYASKAAVAKKDYSAITVRLVYDYNVNTVYFDGIQLYKEEFGNSYTYDANGNVISVTDLQKKTTTYEYDTSNNLSRILQNNKAKVTYTYDNYHNVKTATTETGTVYQFAYDTYGNNTSVSIGNGITATAAYSADGNRLVSTTDALGKVTAYGYNGDTNELEWVQYPEDTEATRTEYTYDGMYRIATAACSTDTGSNLSASYTYVGDRLTKIETGSTTYNFGYGDFYLRTGVSVGDRTLAEYTYTGDRNNYLQSLDYGNDGSVEYTYDTKGRVTSETYEDGDTVAYQYDNNGALAKVTDSATGITTTYYYDLTDRMMKYAESGVGYSHSVGYEYDTLNNLTQLVENINGTDHTTTYTYDEDNRVKTTTTGNVTVEYAYDDFGRIETQTTKNGTTVVLTESYTYKAPTSATTSAQIATYTTSAPDGYSVTYSYTYDDNGNIASISDGTNTTSYVYDSANQLIRENNQAANYTQTWTYDNAGNITCRTECAYTTGSLENVEPIDTVTYTYGNSAWGDLLTAYDGQTITSDTIGNTLSDGTWTYTWEHGRRLASMSDGSTTWTYTYNADGLRTKRTDGTKTYTYVYNGSQLTQMTVGEDTLYFGYDANGTPTAVTYNGAIYYYVTNLQGDVIAVLDANRASVVEYTYDAWGNLLTTTGTMADTLGQANPLRYRGYVYDNETGLYYVSSRYYDPEIGRWINADSVIDQSSVLGYNLFAYCRNNPVNMTDTTGNLPFFAITAAIGAVVGAVVGGVVAAKNGGNVWAGIGIGAAAGGLIGAGAGAAAGALLAGSAAASTTSVVIGAKAVVSVVGSAGFSAGVKMLADNASQACSNVSQVFWSGGDVAKNAAKQVANEIGGKTLEMTRVGAYLEQINAPYSAWQAASSNFANVASNSSSAIYSIQNASGVGIQSIWATIEYPLLQGKDIIYGVVSQSGLIQIMP